MQKEVANFSVSFVQVLDESGKVDKELMPKISDQQLVSLYEWMVLTRLFDEKCVNLQRQGRLLTYAPMKGQEATIIGSSFVLDKDDWMVPCFRESGAFLVRGFPMEMLLQYWGGDERGMKIPQGVNTLPIAIPVGTQTLHATCIGFALKYKKEKAAVIAYFGDGATSEGDVHEALNFAGVLQLPVVFVCQNNQWAISVPLKQQTASQTLAQKGFAYGFSNCVQVDGNDVLAVVKTVQDALVRARAGKGPSFIECVTYRLSNHTTADDYHKYRSDAEVVAWSKKDPIVRLQKLLLSKKLWSDSYEKELWGRLAKQVDDAVKKYESLPPADPLDIFKFMYAQMTPALEEQMRSLKQELGGGL